MFEAIPEDPRQRLAVGMHQLEGVAPHEVREGGPDARADALA
jgi:hypothetical protein